MAGSTQDDILNTPDDELQAKIAERAYYRAEQRGFAPGYELEDWIEAEKEVRGATQGEEEPEEPIRLA